MEKAPDHDSQGLLFSGAGEMNRTPDILIASLQRLRKVALNAAVHAVFERARFAEVKPF